MRSLCLSIVVLTLFSACTNNKSQKDDSSEQTTIVFGSCTHQDNPNQLWEEINAESSDLFILLGDNIYGDSHNMDTLKAKYDKQKARPAYQKLIKNTHVIGIWDDHDYGVNDGGKQFHRKDSSKLLMLDFLDVAEDDEIRNRQGAYSSHELVHGDRVIKIFLLDTRYFRDTLIADTLTNNRYFINETGDILGEAQWAWLKSELSNSTADINIIGSGIQVIAKEHGFEKWSNFPTSRNRLLKLIGETSPSNTLIISGDRHIAELSAMEVDGLNYPLYDFTASGLTHTWSEVWEEANQYRIGELIIKRNYGVIEIDWEAEEADLLVKGDNREVFLQHTIPLILN